LRYKIPDEPKTAGSDLPSNKPGAFLMRTVLFTGLPGSGKSTAVLSLAHFLKERERPQAVAVIETESGVKEVIRKLSSDSAFIGIDLTRGCIGCTSLTSGLCNALEILHSGPKPSWLLIESSSLAFQTVKDMVLQTLPNEAQPFTVLMIEAGGWAELYQDAPLLADGLASGADLALVNIFTPIPPQEFSSIAEGIARVSPACHVEAVSAPELDPGRVFGSLLETGFDREAGPLARSARGTADQSASVPPPSS
jgi:G3E family GTPase